MKKLFMAICVIFIGFSAAYAQRGKQAVGFGLSYGTEVKSLGVGVKYQYNLTDPIRFEPSLNYFFESDGLSMFDLNANVHYLCPVATNVKVYPLIGLTYTNWHLSVDDISSSKGKFGVNLGAGAEFVLDKNWSANLELKYQLVNTFDQGVFNLGLAYHF